MNKVKYDALIVGSGISGIFTALNLSEDMKVLLITKSSIEESNSYLAQGGIAVTTKESDIQSHIDDSLMAGQNLNDLEMLKVMIEEGNMNLERLIELGVQFDRNGNDNLLFTKEAAHSINRIVHHKDITGKAVIDALNLKVKERKNVDIYQSTFLVDIVTENGEVKGAIILHENRPIFVSVPNIVLATGGVGQLYTRTTNAKIATGDGIASAFRAGAKIRDMEFIQFHPTAANFGDSTFLISEAVRGEGGIIRDKSGYAFMKDYHELSDLAPRDIVSRSILSHMQKQGSKEVYIDVTHFKEGYFRERFPNIYRYCMDHGIDPERELIPIAPAEHYLMGGIATDVDGRTNIGGLYACGEAASTKVHGANRLASNSLLEAIVFANRVANDLSESGSRDRNRIDASYNLLIDSEPDFEEDYNLLKEEMNKYVSVYKQRSKLKKTLIMIEALHDKYKDVNYMDLQFMEFKNMMIVSTLIILGALSREESVGAHYLEDK